MTNAIDDEHAELMAEHADLEAEHKRLEKRPKDIDGIVLTLSDCAPT